jgi:hypothetical protein
MSKLHRCDFPIVLAFVFASCAAAPAQPQVFESYYLYLVDGDCPEDDAPGWHAEVQGIAHDQEYWYITQKDALWRIHVEHDLRTDPWSDSRTRRLLLSAIPELSNLGYNHFGDFTCHLYDGHAYLAIPLTNPSEPPVMAFFEGADAGDELNYIGHTVLEDGGGTPLGGSGWCAIDSGGYIWTSSGSATPIHKYSLDWSDLAFGSVVLTWEASATLRDENGAAITKNHMQGGVFSESGDLLYLMSGYIDGYHDHDGITVFDTSTWRRVAQSGTGDVLFRYEFHPEGYIDEEPEGLTIWDLEDGPAPGIGGRLHALMLDNEASDDDDTVYLKHYTQTVHVDWQWGGAEWGTRDYPFNTITEANDQCWNGACLVIRQGSYSEALTFSNRMQVIADGGDMTIGQ